MHALSAEGSPNFNALPFTYVFSACQATNVIRIACGARSIDEDTKDLFMGYCT